MIPATYAPVISAIPKNFSAQNANIKMPETLKKRISDMETGVGSWIL